MKKVDEYIEQYKAADDKAAVVVTILRMMLLDEVKALIDERKIRTDRGICAVFTEQDGRWRSFARKASRLDNVDAAEMPNPGAFVHFHPKLWGQDVTTRWLASKATA